MLELKEFITVQMKGMKAMKFSSGDIIIRFFHSSVKISLVDKNPLYYTNVYSMSHDFSKYSIDILSVGYGLRKFSLTDIQLITNFRYINKEKFEDFLIALLDKN